MKIWITRHGQTKYNKKKLMQGLTDEPLNEVGEAQAQRVSDMIGDVHFDAVYASPLKRAIKTASIISGRPMTEIIVDPRIIEVDFGKYELKPYAGMGPAMSAFWLWPEVVPAPETVEPVASMVARSSAFLKEIESKDYENVLIVCHGGIIRALRGYMEDRKNGIKWRPKPHNCEVRIYESVGGKHRFIKSMRPDRK